jgi:hypothetical protein
MLGEGAETGTGQSFVLGANVGPDSGRVFQGEVVSSIVQVRETLTAQPDQQVPPPTTTTPLPPSTTTSEKPTWTSSIS